MDKAIARASEIKVRLLNNIGSSESSSKFLSGEIDLERVKPSRFNL